ncbi:MAG: hypothetical protein H0V66_13530, partial [Bdellovibrionales bacterium]|nr:hypothetical protein [Bdellovibrionales bacterium]
MPIFLFAMIFFTLSGFAIETSPPDFSFQDGQAVFVDFKHAHYKMTFDFKKRTSTIVAKIKFFQDKTGYPIFDIRTEIKDIKINSSSTSASEVMPPKAETTIRVLNQPLASGFHELEVTSDVGEFAGGIEFRGGKLDFDFSLSDLEDREFFEIWSATNLEFDQFPSEIEIAILNTKIEHTVYHNGTMELKQKNSFKIKFPEYFATSSTFLHIAPVNAYRETSFNILSKTGRDIPVTIY